MLNFTKTLFTELNSNSNQDEYINKKHNSSECVKKLYYALKKDTIIHHTSNYKKGEGSKKQIENYIRENVPEFKKMYKSFNEKYLKQILTFQWIHLNHQVPPKDHQEIYYKLMYYYHIDITCLNSKLDKIFKQQDSSSSVYFQVDEIEQLILANCMPFIEGIAKQESQSLHIDFEKLLSMLVTYCIYLFLETFYSEVSFPTTLSTVDITKMKENYRKDKFSSQSLNQFYFSFFDEKYIDSYMYEIFSTFSDFHEVYSDYTISSKIKEFDKAPLAPKKVHHCTISVREYYADFAHLLFTTKEFKLLEPYLDQKTPLTPQQIIRCKNQLVSLSKLINGMFDKPDHVSLDSSSFINYFDRSARIALLFEKYYGLHTIETSIELYQKLMNNKYNDDYIADVVRKCQEVSYCDYSTLASNYFYHACVNQLLEPEKDNFLMIFSELASFINRIVAPLIMNLTYYSANYISQEKKLSKELLFLYYCKLYDRKSSDACIKNTSFHPFRNDFLCDKKVPSYIPVKLWQQYTKLINKRTCFDTCLTYAPSEDIYTALAYYAYNDMMLYSGENAYPHSGFIHDLISDCQKYLTAYNPILDF